MSELKVIIGKKIRSLRKKMGLTQEKLSEISNIHPTYLGQIERGEKEPSLKTLIRIADALNTSTSYLLSRESKHPKAIEELIGLLDGRSKKDVETLSKIAEVLFSKRKD